MATWGAALATALTIIAAALVDWRNRRAEKKDSIDETNIQEFRQDLADGNIDAVAADQHDRVQRALCGDSGGGDGSREKSDH